EFVAFTQTRTLASLSFSNGLEDNKAHVASSTPPFSRLVPVFPASTTAIAYRMRFAGGAARSPRVFDSPNRTIRLAQRQELSELAATAMCRASRRIPAVNM